MKKKRIAITICLGLGVTLAVLGLMGSGVTHAAPTATYTVTTLADENDGCGAGTGCSLREAVLVANSSAGHDTIDFAVSGTIVLTSSLPAISSSITISGPGADLLSVSGANAYRPFTLDSSSALTITGITVRDGYAPWGGGIESSGSLRLEGVDVISNSAFSYGGGIRSWGNLHLENVQVVGNLASYGGGGLQIDSGSATLTGTHITGNSALTYSQGGGVYVASSTAFFTQTNGLLGYNSAAFGGGLFVGEGSATLIGTQVISNSASLGGGGVYVAFDGDVALTGAEVTRNSAPYGGGALVNYATATLAGAKLTDNSAAHGSALFLYRGAITSTTSLTITGDVLQEGGTFAASDYDLVIEGTLVLSAGHFYAPNAPNSLLLTGPFTHTGGTYHQTQPVNGSTDVAFPGPGGVIINANGQDLGSTEVALTAGADCAGVPAGSTVHHCHIISPTNSTSVSATVTFYYRNDETGAGHSCQTIEAFRWDGTWDNVLARDAGYGLAGRVCGNDPQSLRVTDVTTFSAFALRTPFRLTLPLVLRDS